MKISQCDKIIAYMRKHGSITQKEAQHFGCWRLASRICDLRKKGYAINAETVRVKTRDGGTTPIAKYSLLEVKNEQKTNSNRSV